MKICRFMMLVFTAYALTILNAKTDSKKQEVESLDSKTTACHTEPLGEVSKTLESKKDISCLHTRYDKKLDSNSTQNTETRQNNNTNKEETHEYPLLDKKSKDELFGTINTAEIPDAIPAPLTTKALLSVEDWRDTYFIYLYNFTPMENPRHIPNELKGQISFRVPLSRNIFKSGGILYFAFTDTFFFQVFNEKASSPVRDNDFQPEFYLPIL
ncbi:hypothetical protein LS77_010790 [Helicobacter bilis]|uniref:Phosphatidylcholine 1-acylhydrolase n=2 Tax=Helicobacter bilis TaxID=37372 RepID=A0A6D2C225_9HELI|nr:phospholipase A [Helicobacter bilis]EMZ37834.1 hypothetical protein C826_01914 [Helicobacter bilis WiWa]TLE02387.1 hypothetical protein LS77_010790 [Helicobacter bilis]TLE03066.1 hypothetical protein LS76_010755 [Helicobacter bilis]